MSGRRPARALLALALVAMPAMAAAQDQCRTIRAMTNADGRKFADLSFGFGRNPYRMTIRSGREEGLPTPDHCDLAAESDEVSFTCYWARGDYAAMTGVFDGLFARLQTCLGGGLTAPAGPSPYGDAIALRKSRTALPADGGETVVELALIEAAATADLDRSHYVTLNVTHEPRQD
jgi:hypothetical protein